MHQFYRLYFGRAFASQVDAHFKENEITPQVGAQFGKTAESAIWDIPWGHHKAIMDKCKGNLDKALLYVRKTIENNWSRSVLLNFLSTDLYERQGKAISNFSLTLPAEQSDLAQEITKDPYNFDFLTLQER